MSEKVNSSFTDKLSVTAFVGVQSGVWERGCHLQAPEKCEN